MANQIRKIGAGTNALSPSDLFIEIDNVTSGDTVDIYLPNTNLILNDNQIYSYVGIRILSLVDEKTVTVNLIAQDGDLINLNSVINTNASSLTDGTVLFLIGQGNWKLLSIK